VELNQPAPDFSLLDLAGQLHRLGELRGRIVIVNFWSAECPWAERADGELLSYLSGWGDRVTLLTVAANANEPNELVAAVARAHSLPFVLRGSREVLDAYGAQTTPHLFVVDAAGLLRYRGAMDDVTFRNRTVTRLYLKEAVDVLLAGHLPDPAETPAYGCAVIRHLPESC
jgi:hypothetical protein